MRKNLYQIFGPGLLLIFIFTGQLFALDGNTNSHDPGALIKEGNKYWMFTTGAGIYAAYSEDLFQWTAAPKTVFPIGTWPEWINEAVPGFEGIFWAPECVYLNGRYYLYYSCSTFGSSRSAIGVASSPTLDQDSPDYQWTDHGMVVSSAVPTDVNAIDPAIFKDDDGRVYMSYGSFSGGIGVVELDPATGKRKEGAAIEVVAGGNNASWEAPYIFKEGSYYYMIVNRGFCCRGTSSTYYLVMGRSTSINGPYVDKEGHDLTNGGGTTILGSSGKYIAPGHFGLLRENGWNYVSIHYYDGNDNGNPKLDIVNMGFDDAGWPFITRDWVAAGRYKVTNQNSKLSWDSWGCSGREGEPLTQGSWADLLCQQWDFTPVGDGVYTIKSAQSGRALSLSAAETAGSCNTDWGAKLELAEPQNVDCQKFKVERTASGAYVFTSMASNLVVEVPWASQDPGVELIVWGHNGCNCQRWYINDPESPIVSKVSNTAPANNATVSYENLRLEWTGNAQSYNIYVGSAADKLELKASNIGGNAYTPGEALALGEYYWRADAVLNGQTATGDVWSFTVEDKVPPTVVVKNISLPLNSDGSLSISPEDIDDGSFDAYGIADLSLDKTSFNCSNLGENEVVLSVTDNNGNTATASATVNIEGAVPAPSIRVSRSDDTFTGGDEHTIFLGYGAQALTLTATDLSSEGTSTYEWQPAGLSNNTGASPSFVPTKAGTYIFTVTATNEFGCVANAEVTITVIDVRCGNKSEKVQVCHKGEFLCVDPLSVQDHLNHGCSIGDCTNAPNASRLTSGIDGQATLAETGVLDNERLIVFPNPAGSHATIAFSLAAADHYSLMLYNSNGKLLETLVRGSLTTNEQGVFELRTEKYTQGIYLLQLVTKNEVISKRVLIQK